MGCKGGVYCDCIDTGKCFYPDDEPEKEVVNCNPKMDEKHKIGSIVEVIKHRVAIMTSMGGNRVVLRGGSDIPLDVDLISSAAEVLQKEYHISYNVQAVGGKMCIDVLEVVW